MNGATDDYFGYSVSLSGDTAIVGSYLVDDRGTNAGAAFIFERVAGTWSEKARLTASDGEEYDRFGYSVAVNGDTAIVGALQDDDRGGNAGAAFVFERVAGVWSEKAKLTASDGETGDKFGASVSVHGDTILVGADNDSTDKGQWSGSVYFFELVGGTWTEKAKKVASEGGSGDRFGDTVSVSGDRAIVGAPHADDKGTNSGEAYIFERVAGTWSEKAKLTASDGTDDVRFGRSVSVSGDTAIVGAYFDDAKGERSGAAYIFERVAGAWLETQKLTASDGTDGDRFGFSVSVSGDTALVGAHENDGGGRNAGAAYVFERVAGEWSEQMKVTASDHASDDYFGFSVAVSGGTALVGAYGDDDQGGRSGSAYAYSCM
jgi:hypothetical protein